MTDQKETPTEYITKVAVKLLNYCTEDPDFLPQPQPHHLPQNVVELRTTEAVAKPTKSNPRSVKL